MAGLVLACDPLTPPVADEPDAPEPALAVVLVTLSADTVPDWLAGEEVALPEFADSEL